MECSREREILDVATIKRHGLTLKKKMSDSSDNDYAQGLLKYFTTSNKSKETLKSIKTNKISDIFQSFTNNNGCTTIPKFILIEGAPGMGKTTLCKEIAYQWAKKCLLDDTKLLFLLHLRDLPILNMKSLKDLVHYFYAFDEVATNLSKECSKIWSQKDGRDLTILFDGYDEFIGSSDLLITNILDRKVLPQCRIVVTSRLTASGRLHSMADVRVQVMGFTDESKIQYIEQELRNYPDKIKKLQFYLDDHESIKSICYMPMMMTILVYVFKEKGQLPSNSIELYNKFVALTISHYLQRQKKTGDFFVLLQTLPNQCKYILSHLSKFAFLILQTEKKVFGKEDIKELCPHLMLVSSDLDNLGIINSVQYLSTDKGNVCVFSFVHLSIHEYLAAYYISSIDQSRQFNELRSTFLNKVYHGTWNMFIAMNKKSWLNFHNYSVYCEDIHSESISEWIADVKSLSLFDVDCFIQLYYNINNNVISSDVQILLSKEDKNPPNACQSHLYLSWYNAEKTKLEMFVVDSAVDVYNSDCFNLFMKLLINDYSIVLCTDHGLFLNKISQQQVVNIFKYNPSIEYVVWNDCHISESTIAAINISCLQHISRFHVFNCTFEHNALIKFSKLLSSINTLLYVAFDSCHFSTEEVDTKCSVISNNSNIQVLELKCLNINSNQITEAGEALASVILHNTGLEELNLSGNNLGEGMLNIAKALQHLSSLKSLDVSNSNISNKVSGELSLAITANKHLEDLHLYDTNLQYSAIVILQSLTTISTLKTLNINNNQITEEAGEALASVILHNRGLEELHLSGNNLGEELLNIAKALQHISSLKSLDFSNNNISKNVFGELSLAITANKYLEDLHLSNTNLQYSAIAMLQSLATISKLKKLNLNNNQITEKAAEALVSVILLNTGLEELYLSDNNLGEGASKVVNAMLHITSLKILNFKNNAIPKKSSNKLGRALKLNKHLEMLWLNNNNLQSSAISILQSLSSISSLKYLNMNNNQITEEAGEALASVLLHNKGLEELHLSGNNLGEGVIIVAKALQNISSLKSLNLGNNNIPKEGSGELAHAFKLNKHLQKLWLYDSNLKSSAKVILQSLGTISTLKLINLESNEITEEAGEALASVILHNTGLEELDISSNNLGEGILIVAKALQHISSLKSLYLGNNNISKEVSNELAMAITANKYLDKMRLYNTNLKSSVKVIESVSTISTLNHLDINNNQITEEAGVALASVILQDRELYVSSNNLGEEVLSIMKALHHVTSLTMLSLCYNNISKEVAIELALTIKSNKHLQKLWLNNNNLRSSATVILQSLSTISTLKYLNLDSNQITEEASEALASVILHNTGLEKLDLSGNNLGEGILIVAKALQHISSLKSLYLGNNNISKEVSNELAMAITANKYLDKMRLYNTNLKSSVKVIESVSTISTLNHLDINNNQITEETGVALASVILQDRELYVSSNNLGEELLSIMKALHHVTSLTMLSLCYNNISKEVAIELALTIKSNKHLQKLWLNNNNLRSSATVILQSLSTISTLKYLNLDSNQINEEASEALASVILHNTRLEELDLSGNNLGEGILIVAKALQQTSSLKSLYLGNNNISKEVSNELALAITANKYLEKMRLYYTNLKSSLMIILLSLSTISTLNHLDINNNQITEEAGVALASVILHDRKLYVSGNNLGEELLSIMKALQHVTSLRMLSFSDSNISQEVAIELALAIKSNKLLQKLWLNNSNLKSSATVIFQSLSTISTLKYLNLDSNQITEEAGEALASVILHNTGLEQLDLSRNSLGEGLLNVAKALKHISSLKFLDFGNNKISKEVSDELSLAITANKCLEDLRLFNTYLQFSAIVILQSLTTISKLKFLSMDNNQITEEAGEALASAILHNKGLEELYLSGNNLGEGLFNVMKALQHITSLTILCLGNNKISKEVAIELALAIKSNKHLQKLWLNNSNLRSSATVILQSLSTISTMKYLNLDSNQITEEADEALASVILHNAGLEYLDVSGNNLGDGLLNVVKALKHISSLKFLDVGNNKISKEVSDELSLAITANKCLEDLRLFNTYLQFSAIVILQSLTTISKLKFLNMNNNEITEEAGEALASAILHNKGLKELYLSGNNLGEGLFNVMKALQHITSLTILCLGNNKISKEVAIELALAIKSNKHLQKLWLNNSNLRSSATVILQSLSTISTLKYLNLDNNQITEEAGEALASVISHNTGLEYLVVSGNNLEEGILIVAKALQHISSLKSLYLGNSNISNEVSNELALAITANKYLEIMQLYKTNLKSLVTVIKPLSTISTLNYLNISSNEITEEAGEALASVILYDRKLYVSGNNLGEELLCIMKALRYVTSLRMLSLSDNNISKEVAIELALAIKSNKHLQKLWLNNSNLRSSATVILQSLSTISTLKYLNLNKNQITEEAGEALASVILHNTGLEELHLSGNSLGERLFNVAKALKHISSLKSLDFGNNNISKQTCDELSLVIAGNKYLEELRLYNTNLQYSAIVILQSLSNISTLKYLNLDSNQITEKAVEALASVIFHNTGLEELHLSGNNLGEELLSIMKSLRHVDSLRMLTLSDNNISKEVAIELALAIKSNKHLQKLWLNNSNLRSSATVILQSLSTISTLKYLNLNKNQITEEAGEALASVILHNTGLEELHLNGNSLGERLFNVAKALKHISSLKSLDFGNNNISKQTCDELSLVIAGNKCLEELRLYNTNLQYSAIVILQSLSNISTLKYLNLINSQTTEEAVAALASVILHNTGLEELYLSDNNLGEGALKIAMALQHINCLKILDLENNVIPKQSASEFGDALKLNKHLEKLWLNNNNLQSSAINILKCLTTISTLKYLNISNNQITKEAGEVLASVILSNIELEELYINGNFLGESLFNVMKALQHVTSLKILNLGNNNISKEVAIELVYAIELNKQLRKLWLNNSNIQSSAIIILQSLSKISTLKYLNINNNHITEEAGEALASVILHNTGLQELHFSDNDLGGALEVAKALQHTTSLRIVDLDNNAIPKESSSDLGLALKLNKHLEKLLLSSNNLQSSAINILQSLSTISTLKSLNLNDNQITEEAGEALASVILHNTGLEELHLSGNNIGEGLFNVMKALQHIMSLTILSLGNNNISKEVSGELALVIESNKQLQKLWLNNCNMQSSAIPILQSLSTISTLKLLNISNNQITGEAGEALASVILHNTGFEKLHLRDNNLGEGMLNVAKALQHISSLRSLDLHNNNISKDLSDELVFAITANKHIEALCLDNSNLSNSTTVILQTLSSISTLNLISIESNQVIKKADEAIILLNGELYLSGTNVEEGLLGVMKALQHVPSLTLVGLRNANISNEVAIKLTSAIQSNKHLEKLWLCNSISKSSAIAIFRSLSNISTLKSLNLNDNQITEEAGEALASVILHNTGLEGLHLSGNNFAEGLFNVMKALQHVTSLKILTLGNNNISKEVSCELALAVESNKQLQKLWLHNNNMQSSAVVILQSLSTILTLKYLNINNNQITEEAGEALASVILHNTGLEELHLNGNNLGEGLLKVVKALKHISSIKSLDFGKNNISKEVSGELSLAIAANNKYLEDLHLSDTNLQYSAIVILKSLTTTSKLKNLNMNNNQLNEEAGEALASVILHNKGLEELYLSGNNLGEGLFNVMKALQHITSLTILCLGNNKISKEVAIELALAIKSNKHLQKLWLNNSNLRSSATVILQSLSTISTLKYLNLDSNQITEKAFEALASVIFHNTGLEELHLSGNNLGEELLSIMKSLQHVDSLRMLTLSDNNISKEVAIELALAIKSNKHLQKLWLNNSNLRSSATVILQSLSTISTLKYLNLNKNQITEEAGEALASVILHNTGLEELHLSGNSLGERLFNVAKALKHISSLKSLDFGNNNISKQTCDELSLVIAGNKYLEELRLYNTNLQYSAIVILQSLSNISTLKYLNLINSQTTEEAVAALASVILHNTGLEELYLSDNNFAEGLFNVMKALQHVTSLKILTLGNSNISKEVSCELALAVESNKQLQKLWLHNNNMQSSAVVILQSLSTILTLKYLNINNNQITEEAGEALASVILHNTGLEELHLNGNNLGEGLLKVVKALKHISSIKSLDFGKNNISKEVSGELSLAIAANNKYLEDLRLGDTNLQYSAIVILKSLTTTSKLKNLNMNNNQLNEEAGEALASVILHNKGLEELYLSGNNFGKGLFNVLKALQHVTSLRILSLGNNNIPKEVSGELALAITANKCLEKLYLYNNNLKYSAIVIFQSLSMISKLKLIQVENNHISEEASEALASVILHNTGLEELDLSGNDLGEGILIVAKALQHISSLKSLYLGNNNISKEVSNELALAITANKYLEKMQLYYTNLKSSVMVIKSVSTILKLNYLNIYSNQINEDAGQAYAFVILQDRELYLSGNNLGEDTLSIMKALQHVNSLRMLSLCDKNISKELAIELALTIKSNKHLQKLWLNNSNLRFSANVIFQSLSTISTLKYLNLHNNQITEEAAETLASVILRNTGLEELHLGDNNLGKGALKVIEALQHITSLRILDLQNNGLTNESSHELRNVFKSNKHIQKLWLNDNNLQSSVINMLQSLSTISTLKYLNMSNNQITEEAGEALASVILHNIRLEELHLNSNNLGEGMLFVAKALQHISSIRSLDMGNNSLSKEVSDELSLAITANKCLEKLYLYNTNLKYSAIVILQSLTMISKLKVIDVENNEITEEAGEVLASVILHNTGLEELALRGNNLGEGISIVAKALQNISLLKSLYLGNNNVSKEVSNELALAITANKYLEKMLLYYTNLKSSVLIILLSLSTISTLNYLNINSNQITEDAGQAFASVILHDRGLYLSGINVGEELLSIMKALHHVTSLRMLSLCDNNISKEVAIEVALAIKSNKHLQKLWLNNSNLRSSATVIFQSLRTISTLKHLNLDNNQITEEAGEALASVILHNKGLEELYLSGNNLGKGLFNVMKALQHITSLTILCLGNNKILKEVSCELALAVQSNKLLQKLRLNNNHLRSSATVILQSLSTISTLKYLNLDNNQITEEAGEALASVILHNTGLEELDLSRNSLGEGLLNVAKALKHISSLKFLDVGNNKISKEVSDELSLAITANKCLEDLHLFNTYLQFSAIVILQSLTTISKLKFLSMNNNQITEEAGEALASAILHNKGLEKLYLSGNNLGEGLLNVMKALHHITSLTILCLGNNKIPKEVAIELALAIKSNKHLQKLWLNNSNLRSSATVILQSLSTISTLKYLNLDNNQITEEAGEALASVILHNIRLEELHLNSNNLGEGMIFVAKSLQHISSIRSLDMGNNSLSKEVSSELALAITANKCLEKLYLCNTNLKYSAIVILQSLSMISKLKLINVENNEITEEAGEALASVILHNTGLEELDISGNNLGEGILIVAKALQQTSSLKSLYLGNNNISKEVSNELALAITANKYLEKMRLYYTNLKSSLMIILLSLSTISTLNYLNINSNQITEDAGQAFASVILHDRGLYLSGINVGEELLSIMKALHHVTSLRMLSLCDNNISKEVAIEVALAIKSNKHLQKLWLNNSNLRSSATVILQSLRTISTLKHLNLDNNQITEEAGEALASVILHNTGLEELDLSRNSLGEGLLNVAKALKHISSLKFLDVGNNKISKEVSDELSLAITANKCLEDLSLFNTYLQFSAIVILQSLTTISKLKFLNMNNNEITKEAGEALASAILHNKELEELYLSGNNLGEGLLNVMKALQHITSLRILSLGNNKISKEVSCELALAVKSNKQLQKLWLYNSNIQLSAIIILQSLSNISTLKYLNINNNHITEEAGETLALVILHNTGLEELHLSCNNFGEGLLKVAKALQHTPSLKSLTFGNNNTSKEVSDKLSLAIKANKCL